MPRFASPDQEQDKKFLDDEASRKGYDWSKTFWKPKPSKKGEDNDNVIRIMPARAGSGATYHAKVGKHFIRHSDTDIESFVCMTETYGLPCPACEARAQIFAEAKAMSKEQGDKHRKKADKFAMKRLGIFNVIDRLAQQAYAEGKSTDKPTVRLWEAPRKLCWERIVRNVASGGRTSNLFDKYDESGAVVKPGRDVLVKFYPESDSPSTMYDVQYLDPVPLGAEAEVAEWFEQIIDLLPEKIAIYAKITYEEAQIKTFGTKEEREALKAEKQRMREEAAAAKGSSGVSEPAQSDAEAEALAEAEADALGVPEEEMPKPAPAAAPKPAAPAPTPAAAKPAPAATKPAATPAPATGGDLKSRIDAVKARMAAGGKK